MKDSCVKENPRLTKLIFWGVIILFGIQFSFLIFAFYFYSEYKNGLINGRLLLWDGLQTWPVVRALLRYLFIHFMILTLVSGISAFAARFLVTRLNVRESASKITVFNLLLIYGSLMVINLYHYPNSLAKLAVVSDWQTANNSVAYYIAITISLVLLAMSVAEVLGNATLQRVGLQVGEDPPPLPQDIGILFAGFGQVLRGVRQFRRARIQLRSQRHDVSRSDQGQDGH
jgi:hypothetical protein